MGGGVRLSLLKSLYRRSSSSSSSCTPLSRRPFSRLAADEYVRPVVTSSQVLSGFGKKKRLALILSVLDILLMLSLSITPPLYLHVLLSAHNLTTGFTRPKMSSTKLLTRLEKPLTSSLLMFNNCLTPTLILKMSWSPSLSP